MSRRWVGVELNKADAEVFKCWCKANGIQICPSQCYNMILVEVYATESEISAANAFLRTI